MKKRQLIFIMLGCAAAILLLQFLSKKMGRELRAKAAAKESEIVQQPDSSLQQGDAIAEKESGYGASAYWLIAGTEPRVQELDGEIEGIKVDGSVCVSLELQQSENSLSYPSKDDKGDPADIRTLSKKLKNGKTVVYIKRLDHHGSRQLLQISLKLRQNSLPVDVSLANAARLERVSQQQITAESLSLSLSGEASCSLGPLNLKACSLSLSDRSTARLGVESPEISLSLSSRSFIELWGAAKAVQLSVSESEVDAAALKAERVRLTSSDSKLKLNAKTLTQESVDSEVINLHR